MGGCRQAEPRHLRDGPPGRGPRGAGSPLCGRLGGERRARPSPRRASPASCSAARRSCVWSWSEGTSPPDARVGCRQPRRFAGNGPSAPAARRHGRRRQVGRGASRTDTGRRQSRNPRRLLRHGAHPWGSASLGLNSTPMRRRGSLLNRPPPSARAPLAPPHPTCRQQPSAPAVRGQEVPARQRTHQTLFGVGERRVNGIDPRQGRHRPCPPAVAARREQPGGLVGAVSVC